jgi:thioredoxin 2
MADVLRCPSCGQANRVPDVGAGKTAVCGRCKAPLTGGGGDGHPLVLTDANFDQVVAAGPPIVVDFWAAWCGPCRTIGPIIEELARERKDVRFGKLDVDANPRTAARFKVQGIPLMVFLSAGTERGRLVGAVPKPQIEAAIRQYLAA